VGEKGERRGWRREWGKGVGVARNGEFSRSRPLGEGAPIGTGQKYAPYAPLRPPKGDFQEEKKGVLITTDI